MTRVAHDLLKCFVKDCAGCVTHYVTSGADGAGAALAGGWHACAQHSNKAFTKALDNLYNTIKAIGRERVPSSWTITLYRYEMNASDLGLGESLFERGRLRPVLTAWPNEQTRPLDH